MGQEKAMGPIEVITSLNGGHVVTATDLFTRATGIAAHLFGWALVIAQWICALALAISVIVFVLNKLMGSDRGTHKAIQMGVGAIFGLIFLYMVPYILVWAQKITS